MIMPSAADGFDRAVYNFRPTVLIENAWNEFTADFERFDLAWIRSNNTSHRLDLFF